MKSQARVRESGGRAQCWSGSDIHLKTCVLNLGRLVKKETNVLLSSKIFKTVREIRKNGIGVRIVENVTFVEHFVHTCRFGIKGAQVKIEITFLESGAGRGSRTPKALSTGEF
jgi:hypothetical protein